MKDYFLIDKMQFGQAIDLNELKYQLAEVEMFFRWYNKGWLRTVTFYTNKTLNSISYIVHMPFAR